jgi:hypothetical protein
MCKKLAENNKDKKKKIHRCRQCRRRSFSDHCKRTWGAPAQYVVVSETCGLVVEHIQTYLNICRLIQRHVKYGKS